MSKEATIGVRIAARHTGANVFSQKTCHVPLPANIELAVEIGDKKGRLVIAVTEDGILNLGDPDKSMWKQEAE